MEAEGAGILNLKYLILHIFANFDIEFSEVDYLEEFCIEISDFCLPKKAPELSREVSLWVSGFLERKSQFKIFLAPAFPKPGCTKVRLLASK